MCSSTELLAACASLTIQSVMPLVIADAARTSAQTGLPPSDALIQETATRIAVDLATAIIAECENREKENTDDDA